MIPIISNVWLSPSIFKKYMKIGNENKHDNKIFPVKIPMFQDKNKYKHKMFASMKRKYLRFWIPVALLFPQAGQTINSTMMETGRKTL